MKASVAPANHCRPMVAGSVLWKCPVRVRLGSGGGGTKECILCPQTEEWQITVDDGVDAGVMSVGAGAGVGWKGVAWVRVRELQEEEGEARWIKAVPSVGGDGIRMSALTVWRYFAKRAEGPQCCVRVAFSPLPDYIELHTRSPVPEALQVTVKLLADFCTEEALLCRALPQRLLGGLRSLPPTVCRDGDSQWVLLGGDGGENGQSLNCSAPLPVQFTGLGGEAFVDFASASVVVDVESVPAAELPPVTERSLASEIFSALVADVARTLSRLPPSRPEIVALSGRCGSGKLAIAVAACRSRGIPARILAIDSMDQVSRGSLPGAWMLRAGGPSDHLYGIVREIAQMKTDAPQVVFLLLEGEEAAPRPEDKICRLLAEHWPVPALDPHQRRLLLGRLQVADEQAVSDSAGLHLAGIEAAVDFWRLDGGTLGDAIKAVRRRTTHEHDRAEIPKVRWEDVAGLEDAKRLLMETISMPLLERHRVPERLGRRCGLLLYGPPGTGKTMLAKAVATEFSLHFISIKGPELLDIYVGESEAQVRRVFERARRRRPCVLFFDELDSLAVARGRDGDSGGVTDRLVSQFLAEMDTLYWDAEGRDVFVIGATNRPDLLDGALLRPGRFDKMVYLGLPATSSEQAAILRAASRNYLTSVDVDFDQMAEGLAKTLTPADLAAICHSAMRTAVGRVIERAEGGGCGAAAAREYAVTVGRADFDEAILSAHPSVSPADLALYHRLQM